MGAAAPSASRALSKMGLSWYKGLLEPEKPTGLLSPSLWHCRPQLPRWGGAFENGEDKRDPGAQSEPGVGVVNLLPFSPVASASRAHPPGALGPSPSSELPDGVGGGRPGPGLPPA